METRWKAVLLLACVLLQGCATQLSMPGANIELRFQSNSIAPAAIVESTALQPGDILLSAEATVVSAGIRVMTLAPVSHAALYVGDGKLVDAMRPGVRVRRLEDLVDEAAVVLVLRYPQLTTEQASVITEYAIGRSGAGFNFAGITLQIPFSLTRRLCELPLVPPTVRDVCIQTMGVMPQLAGGESQVFCSQLVLLAYRHAGVPITAADPRVMSPADILHMREGDVSSVRVPKQLRYVGHLKYERPAMSLAALE